MLKKYFERLHNLDQYNEVVAHLRRRHRFRISEDAIIFCADYNKIKHRGMSSMFYRRPEKVKDAHGYGFEKRSKQEIKTITDRLSCYSGCSRPQYVANYATSGRNSPSRVPSGCGRRTTSSADYSSRISSAGKRLTEKEMQRLLRRLQKPTQSYTHATNDYEGQKPIVVKSGKDHVTKVDEETEKFVQRISRPTTASRAKRFTECYLCYEHAQKKPSDPPDAFDYDYSQDKTAPPEEVDYIISRMRIPTCSSAHGQRTCSKTPVTIDEVKIREKLPLVSGLERSKNFREITDRLHPKSKYRFLPEATPITIYC